MIFQSLSRLSNRGGTTDRRDDFLSTTSRTSTSAASVTLTSASSRTEESEDESRRKVGDRASHHSEAAAVTVHDVCSPDRSLQRYPADKAYYIAKELLMTERTYKKDLEVLTVVSEY